MRRRVRTLTDSIVQKSRWRTWRYMTKVRCREIQDVLERLIGESRDCLFMHSSLSACGYIDGGPSSIVETVSPFATTQCLPTNAYCYSKHVSELGPVFDPSTSPSKVGQITEYFRRQPGCVRSIHPTHAIAAQGPGAQDLCGGHELIDTPCGKGSPYAKLVERDASVLMFGVTVNAYTLFHTAEDAAGCPYLYFPEQWRLRARDYDGNVHQINMRRQDMTVTRRFAKMDVVLEREGLLRRTRLGRGELLFIPSSRNVHEFLLDQMKRDPYYLVAEDYRRERGW